MEAIEYYTDQLNDPLTAWMLEIPTGDALTRKLEFLPPAPDDKVRDLPAKKRLSLLTNLKQLHVPLGRDLALMYTLLDLIRDGLACRAPTVSYNIASRDEKGETLR